MTAEDIPDHPSPAEVRRGQAAVHRVGCGGTRAGVAAQVVRSWLEETGSGTLTSHRPASPWQNGYEESFHGKLRDEFLNREEFEDESQARALGAAWKEEYNTERRTVPCAQDPGPVPGDLCEVCAYR